MFKKTEETEWSRFSKALSPREQAEGEDAADAESSSSPAGASSASRGDITAQAPATRSPAPEASGSVRTSSRPPAAPVADEEMESTIGEQTTVEGTYKSDNSIRICGSVKGEIESQRSILVDSQAHVSAKVTASAVTVAGEVDGHIFCTGRVEIRPSGRVMGEINAGTLVMQEGAFFEGNLRMGDKAGQAAPAASKATAKF
jgi:cytoskeletal protein CcmA (bactofilin family)